jgi:hypothetical protein
MRDIHASTKLDPWRDIAIVFAVRKEVICQEPVAASTVAAHVAALRVVIVIAAHREVGGRTRTADSCTRSADRMSNRVLVRRNGHFLGSYFGDKGTTGGTTSGEWSEGVIELVSEQPPPVPKKALFSQEHVANI